MSRVSTSMPMFRNQRFTRTDSSQNQMTDSKASVHPSEPTPHFTDLAKLTSSDGTEMKIATPADSIPEVVRSGFDQHFFAAMLTPLTYPSATLL